MHNNSGEEWNMIIKPKSGLFEFNFKEIYQYRDLLFMFVKRDIVVVYKQTILGPLWFFVQPVMTTIIYTFIFSNIAKIPIEGSSPTLFYLSGIIMWNYFADCFNQTSDTFSQNANIFGKVYFPRLIIPISKILSGLIKYFIQFLLFLSIYIYVLVTVKENSLYPNYFIFLFPVLLAIMAFMGLGFGLIFTSLTTKYRDLKFLIQFGVQLLMYATPIIYSLSQIPVEYKFWIQINPLSHIIEAFKFGFIGVGEISLSGLLYSFVFTIIVLFIGILIFNRNEKTFMDTV